jgi:DNA adenine methylase
VPYGRYANLNTSLVTNAHSTLLTKAEIYNLDYSEIFNMANEDDFMFLDPPYDCVFLIMEMLNIKTVLTKKII